MVGVDIVLKAFSNAFIYPSVQSTFKLMQDRIYNQMFNKGNYFSDPQNLTVKFIVTYILLLFYKSYP